MCPLGPCDVLPYGGAPGGVSGNDALPPTRHRLGKPAFLHEHQPNLLPARHSHHRWGHDRFWQSHLNHPSIRVGKGSIINRSVSESVYSRTFYSFSWKSTSLCFRCHFSLKAVYLFDLNLFIQGRLRNKLSQLIVITLDRSFRMVSISFFERGLRGERSQTCPYMLSAKQGSIWCHFYNVFGMTRSGIEPTTSRSRGERSYHWVYLFKTSRTIKDARSVSLYPYNRSQILQYVKYTK